MGWLELAYCHKNVLKSVGVKWAALMWTLSRCSWADLLFFEVSWGVDGSFCIWCFGSGDVLYRFQITWNIQLGKEIIRLCLGKLYNKPHQGLLSTCGVVLVCSVLPVFLHQCFKWAANHYTDYSFREDKTEKPRIIKASCKQIHLKTLANQLLLI